MLDPRHIQLGSHNNRLFDQTRPLIDPMFFQVLIHFVSIPPTDYVRLNYA